MAQNFVIFMFLYHTYATKPKMMNYTEMLYLKEMNARLVQWPFT